MKKAIILSLALFLFAMPVIGSSSLDYYHGKALKDRGFPQGEEPHYLFPPACYVDPHLSGLEQEEWEALCANVANRVYIPQSIEEFYEWLGEENLTTEINGGSWLATYDGTTSPGPDELHAAANVAIEVIEPLEGTE